MTSATIIQPFFGEISSITRVKGSVCDQHYFHEEREQQEVNHTCTMQFQRCTSRWYACGTQKNYDYLTEGEMSTGKMTADNMVT